MPSYVQSSYGFGEAICKARAFVRWSGEADCDAVVCVMMLERREFARAMWAARFTATLENAAYGEDLTNSILQNKLVCDAINQVRKNPQSWSTIMNANGSAPA